MKFLLDTNTCIAVMRNHPQVLQKVAAFSPPDFAISTITSYELYTGIEKCANPTKERAKVSLFLKTVIPLPFNEQAAQEAAKIRGLLESQGKMIGPYDILIAGQTLAENLILVTANTAEFSRVPGIMLENWQTTP